MNPVDLAEQGWLLLNVLLAAFLGGVIGFERDRALKPAGTRTQALVSAAACLIVGMGVVISTGSDFGDPARSLHAVITGIGFLGGAVVLNSARAGARGVTTAATIFTTAAIGASVGLGFQLTAIGAVITVIVILRAGRLLDRRSRKKTPSKE